MSLVIRDVALADRQQWGLLWKGYLEFYKETIPDAVTDTTWSRFFDQAEPVNCMVAEDDGKLVGLVHYVFHRNTWMTEDVCYLEDLFTAQDARGKGVGRKLIQAVYDKAKAVGLSRVYWVTHETNKQAMILYDKVAEKPGFVQYRKDF
jgi:GNAT superfamily N-acetyltransferase